MPLGEAVLSCQGRIGKAAGVVLTNPAVALFSAQCPASWYSDAVAAKLPDEHLGRGDTNQTGDGMLRLDVYRYGQPTAAVVIHQLQRVLVAYELGDALKLDGKAR